MEQNNNGLEQLYLTAAEKGNIHTLKRMLRNEGDIDINARDVKGRSALQLAIEHGQLEAMSILLNHGVKIGDALLYAVDAKFHKAVELLINNAGDQDIINSHPSDDSEDFHPDITPIILAAHHNDYDIIKLLEEKGAPHITLSDIHTEKHTVERSVGQLNIYKAVASEAYISFIEVERKDNSDPFGKAFELSADLRRMSSLEPEFRKEYLDLSDQCETFAAELLGQTRDANELRTVLNHESKGSAKTKRQMYLPSKVVYAVKKNQQKFVTHPYCQQELRERWYNGLSNWRDFSKPLKVVLSVLIMLISPILSLMYIFIPWGKIRNFMRVPYIKFLSHTASYAFFIVMLFMTTSPYQSEFSGEEELMRMQIRSQRRGSIPTELEFLVMIWIIGMVWREIKELWSEGASAYFSDSWNLYDFIQLSLYLAWIGLRVMAYVKVHEEAIPHLSKRDTSFNNASSEITIEDLAREHMDTRLHTGNLLENVTAQLLHNMTQMVEILQSSHQYNEILNLNMTQSLTHIIDLVTGLIPTELPPTTAVPVNGSDVDKLVSRSEWDSADPTLVADCVMSLANVISVIRILRIMVINEYTGPLQISFSKMMTDIIKFLFIFGVIWVAFALGMTELYWSYAAEEKLECLRNGGTQHDCGNQMFSGIGTSLMSLFWSLYGLIDLEVLHVDANHQSTEIFGNILFAGYSVAAIVILLNLLIALMGTTYEAVVENADTEWKYARSEMWLDYFRSGATVPPPYNMIPTLKSILKLVQFVWNKTCGRRCGKKVTWATRRPNGMQDNYKDVCKQLVLRYFAEKASIARESGDSGFLKEDLMTMKQDMSSIRYELYGIEQKLQETTEHFDDIGDSVTKQITTLHTNVKENREAEHDELSHAQSELVVLNERSHTLLNDLDKKLVTMQEQNSDQREEAKTAMTSILTGLKTDIAENRAEGAVMLQDVQTHISVKSAREKIVLMDLQSTLAAIQQHLIEHEKSRAIMIADIQTLTEKIETLSFQATSLVSDDDELGIVNV